METTELASTALKDLEMEVVTVSLAYIMVFSAIFNSKVVFLVLYQISYRPLEKNKGKPK